MAVFVSGGGTNCENIIKYFQGNGQIRIALVLSNKADAPAVGKARRLGVPVEVLPRAEFNDGARLLPLMDAYDIDFIVLAGFLLVVPDFLLVEYPRRIINLHPALLPKFGGIGMYGHHVHEAVKAAGESETGMTVHWVSPEVDGGEIIARFSTPLDSSDTPEDIAAKEHVLEMEHFPKVVEDTIVERFKLDRKAF